MSSSDLFDRFRVIDTDTHLTEPADVWTARVPKKWGDRIPHIQRIDGRDIWFMDGKPMGAPGGVTMAGFDGTAPDSPMGYDDIPAASFDAKARLEFMDREGIYAQVLYPNVGGFGSGRFLDLDEAEFKLDCVRAYNDFLIDWTSADSNRLIPVMATPFWDVKASVAEIQRCASLGHKAVLFGSQPQEFGEPLLGDRHWDPVWAAAQEAGLPISFHIGSGEITEIMNDRMKIGLKTNFARFSSMLFIENAKCISDVIFSGICHRYPNLKFVSVESGAGWLPSVLEGMDWQFKGGGTREEHPEYDLLPSEYFRRQIYGCFWFEEKAVTNAIELYPDNILYETDYPHPTCMHPGPATPAERPREYAERVLGDLPDATLEKVLHSTAATLYRIE